MTENNPIPWPGDGYEVVYADPPWSYENGGVPNGGVDKHYSTMSLKDICGLDVPVADDAICYMWTTVTHAEEAFEVLDSWGFEYKTQAIWDKESEGVGYWFRGQHELLYVGVRGDVSPPDTSSRRSSVFTEPRGSHSEKPDSVRSHIQQAHPNKNRLEMFARERFEGWDAWGDELPPTTQATFYDA